MLRVLWSRSMKGERPGVLLGDDLILLDYLGMRGKQKVAELVCFDLEGRQLWVRPGESGLLALDGNRFLVNSPENELRLINDSGQTIRRSSIGGVSRVSRQGDLLVLATERDVWATDHELHPVWQFS